MIARHRIMQLLPQLLDVVHPRVVYGLEQQLYLWVPREPRLRHTTVVDDVVVHNKAQASRATIGFH